MGMQPIKKRASLSPKQIRGICRQLGCGAVSRITYMGAGQINANYHVRAEVGDVVVRAYSMHSQKEIMAELQALHWLAQHGFLCPQPMSGVLSVSGTPVTVFRFIPGTTVTKPNLSTIKAIGTLTAQLHTLVTGYRSSYTREGEGLATIRTYVRKYKSRIATSDIVNAPELIKQLSDELLTISFDSGLTRGLVHADIKPENVVHSPDRSLWLLDFNNAYHDSLVVDIGATIIWWCISRKQLDTRKVRMFLRAYQKVRPLTTTEKNNILMSIRFGLLKHAFKYSFIAMHTPKFASTKAHYFMGAYYHLPPTLPIP